MKGNLQNHDDLEWLLAWLANGAGERVEFHRDDTLARTEFQADGGGLRLSGYAFEIVWASACGQRHALPIDGRWVGMA